MKSICKYIRKIYFNTSKDMATKAQSYLQPSQATKFIPIPSNVPDEVSVEVTSQTFYGNEYSAPGMLPSEYIRMPTRCYSCGKLMTQKVFEDRLKEGQSLQRVMDETGFVRICCRRTIMTSVVIVQLMKRLDDEKATIRKLSNMTNGITRLTVEDTGLGQVSLGGNLHILEDVPPGASTDIQFHLPTTLTNIVGGEDTGEDNAGINAFEYYMNEVGADTNGEGDPYED